VRTTPADGYAPLLPHANAALYCKAGHNQRLVSMFNNSRVMASTSTMAPEEMWRRYIGQQLMLLTELMVFCVPMYFADHSALPLLGKRKARGRTSACDQHEHFANVRAHVDTVSVRAMALQFARLARVCDVQYDVEDTELFVAFSGLRLSEPRNEEIYFMLHNTSLTPKGTQFQNTYLLYKHLNTNYPVFVSPQTGALNAACSYTIMQVQTAAQLGRLPSMVSTLLCVTGSELQAFNECHSNAAIDDTIYHHLDMLDAAVSSHDVLNSAPPALVMFILSAAERNDTLHPYCTILKLARLLHNPGEVISVSTNISIHCHCRSVQKGFRAMHHPATEPLYLLLDEMQKLYQVS
jgi:hypothetical protein